MLETFRGTPCRVGGLTYDEIAAEVADFSRRAYGDSVFEGMAEKVELQSTEKTTKLFNYGFLNYFKSGEYHHNNQPLIKTLHTAIRNHDMDMFHLYEQSVTSRPPTTLRDTLMFKTSQNGGRQPISIDEVESAESIMKRFCTGGEMFENLYQLMRNIRLMFGFKMHCLLLFCNI